MLDFIKNIRRRQVVNDLKQTPRDKKIANIADITDIGIVCRLDDEASWNILHHFARKMEEQGKHVAFMALLQKEQQLGFVVTHQDTHICRTKVDFNFWGFPNWEAIRDFASHHYGLLVDTVGCDDPFSQYVALRSDADLRVTYAKPDEDPTDIFDLIIRGEGPIDLRSYLSNIVDYLSMIQK